MTTPNKSNNDKQLRFLELKREFPSIKSVIRENWFVVPTSSVFISLIFLLIPFYIPLNGLSGVLQIGGQAISVVLFFILCKLLLNKTRKSWALNKVLDYINSPSHNNPVFFLIEDIISTGLLHGSYTIDEKRPKTERCILKALVDILYSIDFWRDC